MTLADDDSRAGQAHEELAFDFHLQSISMHPSLLHDEFIVCKSVIHRAPSFILSRLSSTKRRKKRSLQLLLRPQLVRVSALLLAAIRRSGWQARVALAADHLVAVVLAGEGFERWFDEAAAETEDEVES